MHTESQHTHTHPGRLSPGKAKKEASVQDQSSLVVTDADSFFLIFLVVFITASQAFVEIGNWLREIHLNYRLRQLIGG